MQIRLRFFLSGVCALAAIAPAALRAANAEHLTALFQLERIALPSLAPDGRHLAYVIRDKYSDRIAIVAVDQPAQKFVVALDERGRLARITAVIWTSADLLAVTTATPVIYAIDLATKASRRLFDADTFATQPLPQMPRRRRPPQLIAVLPDEPDTVLVEGDSGMNGRRARIAEGAASMQRMKAEREAMRPALFNKNTNGDERENEQGGGALESREERSDNDAQNGAPSAAHEAPIAIAKLNLRTGQWKRIERPLIETAGGTLLYDPQGRPRILQVRDALPARVLYLPANSVANWPADFFSGKGSGNRWEDLDRLTGAGSRPAVDFTVTAENFFGHRSIPLGFGYDPNVLYFASNRGRDTFGIYALDLQTKQRTSLAFEDPAFDLAEVDINRTFAQSRLVFDRQRRQLVGVRFAGVETTTRWVDPELTNLQGQLAAKFPGRNVQILGWDDARERFLLLVASPQDPGRYFVFVRPLDRCVEFFRRGPRIPPEQMSEAVAFAFTTPAGVPLTGTMTLPRASRRTPPPLVVQLHDGPWQRVAPGYNRDAQALADMGFAVLQLNYRGSSGFGERFQSALRTSVDLVPLEDLLATMTWIAPRHPFDPKRVAVMGEGFGGYLALRAAELHPDRFCCVISINGPADLQQIRQTLSVEGAQTQREFRETQQAAATYLLNKPATEIGDGGMIGFSPPQDLAKEAANAFFAGDSTRVKASSMLVQMDRTLVKASSVLAQIDGLTLPVLFAHDPGHPTIPVEPIKAVQKALKKRGNEAEFLAIPREFSTGEGNARAEVYRKIYEFLNDQFYKFKVEVGEARRSE